MNMIFEIDLLLILVKNQYEGAREREKEMT